MKVQEITADIGYEPLKRGKRKKSKALSFVKFILIVIFIMVTLVCLALSPLFSVNRIEVYGNKHYNSSEVIDASGLIMGNNWFKSNTINLKGIVTFRSIEAEEFLLGRCPYLKSVVVSMGMPGVVNITVTERKPVALVPYLGTNLVIDSEGYVLEVGNDSKEDGLPVVKGLVFDRYTLGQALSSDNPESINAFNRVMEIITSSDYNAGERGKKYSIKDIVVYIDVSDLDNVRLYLDSRIVANLGDYRELNERRIDFLREIFYFKLKKDDRGFLDFTSDKYTNFIPD